MTAQSSPDLPASLQRTTRTAAGEDVYQAAAEAWCVARFSYAGPYARPEGRARHIANDARATAHEPSFRAAVDRAVELTEQRVRAETAERIANHADTHFPEPINSAQRTARRWLLTAARIAAGPMTREQAAAALAAGNYAVCNLDEAGQPIQPDDQTGPETALSATLPASGATVEGSDADGPQGGSGGAA